jgi:hemoglobin
MHRRYTRHCVDSPGDRDRHRHGYGRRFGRGGPRARRGDVRAAALALLAERPMHGYEMIKEIEERSGGIWRPSAGSIYPTLQLLEDEGLIRGEESDGRRRFSLTEDGEKANADREGSLPWEEVTAGADPNELRLRKSYFALRAAVQQVARAGTDEQAGRVAELIDEARRGVYAILAEEGWSIAATTKVPTLYEHAGGAEALRRWLDAFYDRVEQDDLISPLFPGGVGEEHRAHVTLWWSEVFGGPSAYTDELGGYPRMLKRHLGLAITAQQRLRFATLMSEAADAAALPDDPEFRSALMAYVEWGTRIAMHNSQPGAGVVREAPVPRWGWGEAPPFDG